MKNSPNVIIHMPDMYDAGLTNGRQEKWKDRFMTTGQTMALGLIRYLPWPGDWSRYGGPKVKQLGQFGVYRFDEEATERLRQEMLKLDPADRWVPNATTTGLGRYKVNPAFNKKLRDIIIRLTGAD